MPAIPVEHEDQAAYDASLKPSLEQEATMLVFNCTGKITTQWQRKLVTRIVALVQNRGGRP